MEKPHLDCKILDKIPFDKYHIFDKDIEFRRRRKDQIIKKEVRLMFSIDLLFQSGLDSDKRISDDLRRAFENNNIKLSKKSTISIEKEASIWLIKNKARTNKQMFIVRKEEEVLNVYEFRTYEIELEFDLHKGWLDDYGKLFKDLQKERSDIEKNKHGPACMLCPVTWKTIELVCKYDLFREVFKDD